MNSNSFPVVIVLYWQSLAKPKGSRLSFWQRKVTVKESRVRQILQSGGGTSAAISGRLRLHSAGRRHICQTRLPTHIWKGMEPSHSHHHSCRNKRGTEFWDTVTMMAMINEFVGSWCLKWISSCWMLILKDKNVNKTYRRKPNIIILCHIQLPGVFIIINELKSQHG